MLVFHSLFLLAFVCDIKKSVNSLHVLPGVNRITSPILNSTRDCVVSGSGAW